MDVGEARADARGPVTLADLRARYAEWLATGEPLRAEMQAAAQEALASGLSESAVARELGISRTTLRKWVGK